MSIALSLVAAGAACVSPLQRAAPRPAATAVARAVSPTETPGRPSVGVAFGGGGARGIAHVGVIRWLEDHRIPVDLAAGTSMGGLVGGAFATGMDGAELERFVTSLDWDQLLSASSFAHKNIRRKTDARAYPARLEFGVRAGIVPPPALNSGEYVELLLARLTAPYFAIEDFDHLATPFRAVAVDLLSAQQVVLRDGSLADAMRATMSLPAIFPPIEINGQVLVDGGTMNNVPADVVRAMGADRVVAVSVGDLSDRKSISYTMFGIAGETLDAMMRASTKRTLAAADVVIDVPLGKYGALDYHRANEIIDQGYQAAEAARDRLLPLAVGEAEFDQWRRNRQARRRTGLPVAAYLELAGFAHDDEKRLQALLGRHVGRRVDASALEVDIAAVAGLDRYETVTWELMQDETRGVGLRVRGRVKAYAPPFLMFGVNLENITSSDFRVSATTRYLTFDTAGSGSELRLDATIGSEPGVAAELYRPIRQTPLFVAPYASAVKLTVNHIEDDAVVARYDQTSARVGLNLGINLGARSDLRAGAYIGRTSASIDIGDPGFPELRGTEGAAELIWRVDTQDSPVVPSAGLVSQLRLSRLFSSPGIVGPEPAVTFDSAVTQLSASANRFWSPKPAHRVFVYGGAGTSFRSQPLPPYQFALGTPFRLGAYGGGALRGSHYYVVTGGYLRRVWRLPAFLGGPVFAGGWLENGDAFDDWQDAGWRTHGGTGVVVDTLFGPLLLGASWSFDGRWRSFVAIGRAFR